MLRAFDGKFVVKGAPEDEMFTVKEEIEDDPEIEEIELEPIEEFMQTEEEGHEY